MASYAPLAPRLRSGGSFIYLSIYISVVLPGESSNMDRIFWRGRRTGETERETERRAAPLSRARGFW